MAAVFVVGGIGYACIELLWRGRTHWSMVLAGGICMSIMFPIFRKPKNGGLLMRSLTGAAIITVVELVMGCVVNIHMGLEIWDYSDRKGNIMGQICPLYTVLWGILSVPVSQLCVLMNEFYERKTRI